MARNEPNRVKDTLTGIRTTDADKEALKALAERIGVSVSSLVVMLVREEYRRRDWKMPKGMK